jgi:RNA polymerase sigma-70 factor (ECF subfamily)
MVLSPYPNMPDDGLAAAAGTGDTGAWEELVQRYRPPILRYLTAHIGDPESAADLTQDTFVVAYSKLGTLRPDVPFVPWLYSVARYHLLPFWRRSHLLRFESLDTLLEHGGTVGTTRQSDELAAVEERDPIRRALSQLSPLLREALLLHVLDGLTAREISDQLEISLAAAEGRICRGAAAFRRHYDGGGPPHRGGPRCGQPQHPGRAVRSTRKNAPGGPP